MGMLKLAVAGALGYVAYKAWQRQDTAQVTGDDDGAADRTPLVTDVSDEHAASPRSGAATA